MFVGDNQLKTCKNYFIDQLKGLFSNLALQQMWKELICERLKWNSADFILNQNELLSESDLLFVKDTVNRLRLNEPFQYIIGHTWFYNLKLKCSPSALIPRPETEELVDWMRNSLQKPDNLLDIGTGSGCIALALKSIFINSNIQAWDVSEEALELAKINAFQLNLNVDFKNVNVLNHNFPDVKFDAIVSNPPYVLLSEKQDMEANVKDYEPHLALFVNDSDPLLFYKKIAEFALTNLTKKGFIFFETHHKYQNELSSWMTEKGFINIEIRKDLQGLDRFLKAQIL